MTPIHTCCALAVTAMPLPHIRRNTTFLRVALPGPVSDVPLSTSDCAPHSCRSARVASICTACLELALARPAASEALPCEGLLLHALTLDALSEGLCGREDEMLQLAGLLAVGELKPELAGAKCGSDTSTSMTLPADT